MGEHLLSTIIALEKELQTQIQEESARAALWRDRQFAELAAEEQQVRSTLMATRAGELEAARRAATAEGEQALAAVRAWCDRLENLADESCIDRLKPLLHRLLPEAGDDHPHGQD